MSRSGDIGPSDHSDSLRTNESGCFDGTLAHRRRHFNLRSWPQTALHNIVAMQQEVYQACKPRISELQWTPSLNTRGGAPIPWLPNPHELDICNAYNMKATISFYPKTRQATQSINWRALHISHDSCHTLPHTSGTPLHNASRSSSHQHVASIPRIGNEDTCIHIIENSATNATQHQSLHLPSRCHEVMTLAPCYFSKSHRGRWDTSQLHSDVRRQITLMFWRITTFQHTDHHLWCGYTRNLSSMSHVDSLTRPFPIPPQSVQ